MFIYDYLMGAIRDYMGDFLMAVFMAIPYFMGWLLTIAMGLGCIYLAWCFFRANWIMRAMGGSSDRALHILLVAALLGAGSFLWLAFLWAPLSISFEKIPTEIPTEINPKIGVTENTSSVNPEVKPQPYSYPSELPSTEHPVVPTEALDRPVINHNI